MLNEHHGLDLDPVDVARLVERTEGWAAGLYMAALSLRGRDDAHDFIATFAGDDRNVVDYLTTEVLNGQSAEVHDFLLSTSVLDRLCPELCDAVTGTSGSAALLRQMEDSNSFVIALDDKRHWYRYHHLFRDLLLHELRVTDPDREVTAHRRAAAWMRDHGDTSEAILHTIAAGDVAEAVEMVAAAWRPYSYIGRTRRSGPGWKLCRRRSIAATHACVSPAPSQRSAWGTSTRSGRGSTGGARARSRAVPRRILLGRRRSAPVFVA